MTSTRKPTVETYNLAAANGRHIRKATRVYLEDATCVQFVELLPKGEAIRQARQAAARVAARDGAQ